MLHSVGVMFLPCRLVFVVFCVKQLRNWHFSGGNVLFKRCSLSTFTCCFANMRVNAKFYSGRFPFTRAAAWPSEPKWLTSPHRQPRGEVAPLRRRQAARVNRTRPMRTDAKRKSARMRGTSPSRGHLWNSCPLLRSSCCPRTSGSTSPTCSCSARTPCSPCASSTR